MLSDPNYIHGGRLGNLPGESPLSAYMADLHRGKSMMMEPNRFNASKGAKGIGNTIFQSDDSYKKYGSPMAGNPGQKMLENTKQFEASLGGSGIRDEVDAFLRGLGESGEDLARIPLAGSPRTIQYSPPGAILKSPHIDSPHMDQLFQRGFRPLSPPQAPPAGPQLPGFV